MMWDYGDDRWRMHDQNGAGWFMAILMVVVVVAVVVAVFALLRWTATPHAAAPGTPAAPRTTDARAILQDRFARGEIDEADFRARMRALDETGPDGT